MIAGTRVEGGSSTCYLGASIMSVLWHSFYFIFLAMLKQSHHGSSVLALYVARLKFLSWQGA